MRDNMKFRKYKEEDLTQMRKMWNEIIDDGVAFPGLELLEEDVFNKMLSEQDAVNCMIRW